MIDISAPKFFKTLVDIVTGSPSSIIFIIVGIIFVIAMVINIKRNKTMGKLLFVLAWGFILVFIFIRYYTYVNSIFDNLINSVFRQIFFPNLATYLIILLISNFVFIRSVISKKVGPVEKIMNSIFFVLIMICFLYLLDIIIDKKINIYTAEEVYTNKKVLILLEATTIVFSVWMLILVSKFVITKLIKKSDQEIKNQYNQVEVPKVEEVATKETPTPGTNIVEAIPVPTAITPTTQVSTNTELTEAVKPSGVQASPVDTPSSQNINQDTPVIQSESPQQQMSTVPSNTSIFAAEPQIETNTPVIEQKVEVNNDKEIEPVKIIKISDVKKTIQKEAETINQPAENIEILDVSKEEDIEVLDI